ncbi:hypothetical protein [Sulfuricurvum sp.]|uniref:5'-methylthioadenosine/S-adenosylhomocysteine nucleosidase family protein n=1 Tax=Sulfuricurvum sp. TaxID=2025608 RepID=UPI003BB4B39D
MTYLITALDAEARAIIEHYRLKRITPLPHTLYAGNNILLLVTGMGKINPLMAISAMLGWRIPQRNDIVINIGICGAPSEYAIQEALLVHQIIDHEKRYYPDILYPHTLRETSLICVDTPQYSPSKFPVDMESSAVFKAASKFFKLHQMAFLKIVSDHFTPDCITKEEVTEHIRSHLKSLEFIIQALQNAHIETILFTSEEREKIEIFKQHFTKSQANSLEDALCFFRLKYRTGTIVLPYELPNSKRERSMLLEEFITTLTA